MSNQTVSKAEAEVRASIDQFIKAIEKKDIETIMGAYAPNAIVYDLHSQCQHKDLTHYRQCWEMCFQCVNDIKYEISDVHIQADDQLAFVHFSGHMTGKRTEQDGNVVPHDIWLRITSCMKKIDGKWLSIHDHCSVPIDCASNAPMWDAKP